MEKLIMSIIEAETLQIIIQEEKEALKTETNPERIKIHKKRIQQGQELNKKYFITLLN